MSVGFCLSVSVGFTLAFLLNHNLRDFMVRRKTNNMASHSKLENELFADLRFPDSVQQILNGNLII